MRSFYRALLTVLSWATVYLPSRNDLLRIWLLLALIVAALVFLSFNVTPSLPQGIYVRFPPGNDVERGALVTFCPSETAARFAIERGYFEPSSTSSSVSCPLQAPPLLKRVNGLPGDTVSVTTSGIFVNGKKRHPPPPHCDRSGDEIPVRYGTHVLDNGEYWVQTDKYLSFDSRVYGPIHRSQIRGQSLPIALVPDQSSPVSDTRRFRRANCESPPSSEPPPDSVTLIGDSTSMDSLARRASGHPLSVTRRFSPPLSFQDYVISAPDSLRSVPLSTSSGLSATVTSPPVP